MLNELLGRKNPRKLVESEIRESEILLLQAHTNAEHWQAQITYHNTKLKRLRSAWNNMQKEGDSKLLTRKDTPE